MRDTRSVHIPRWVTQAMLMLLVLGLIVLTSACGGNAQVQQQANQDKTQLDQLTQHALVIGVLATLLSPIIKHEQHLSSAGAPFSTLNYELVCEYCSHYANI